MVASTPYLFDPHMDVVPSVARPLGSSLDDTYTLIFLLWQFGLHLVCAICRTCRLLPIHLSCLNEVSREGIPSTRAMFLCTIMDGKYCCLMDCRSAVECMLGNEWLTLPDIVKTD